MSNYKQSIFMKKKNYGIIVEENFYYPVTYIIKQDGTKVIENTMLKGMDMTENQIKQLYFSGYFEVKPTAEKVDEYLDFINNKRKCKSATINKIA